ncbi:MAG: ComF family protein, partial [Eubacteriales bacterium]|nr:ComF family protein [Eubacteriales bacterium]
CGVEKGVDDYVCVKCRAQLEEQKAGKTSAYGYSAYALYRYDGAVKKIVKGYKYGGKKWLSRFMAAGLSRAAACKFDGISCICHVPLHKKRRKIRGFDQAEELARRVARAAGLPYVCALKRVKNTKTQTRLSEKERRENIKGAFEKAADVFGNVLLIDDVLTTGATAAECAGVLKEAGAKNVYVLTFAKSAYEISR